MGLGWPSRLGKCSRSSGASPSRARFASTGESSPPTTVQTGLWRGGEGCRVDAEHDVDLLTVDGYPLDQGADQGPLRLPLHLVEALVDRRSEGLQLADQQGQLPLLRGMIHQLAELPFQRGEALVEPADARLEVRLLDQPLRVGVDQAADARAQRAGLRRQRRLVGRGGVAAGLGQAALVLRRQPLGVRQEPPYLLPHRGVQPVGAHLRIVADPVAAEAVGVGAGAAIVGVGTRVPLAGAAADGLAVVGVLAAGAADQALEQVARPALALPRPLPVLRQLLLDRGEQLGGDQGRDGDADPLGRGHILHGVGMLGLRRPVALLAQPGARRPGAGLAEGGLPGVGGVLEDAPDRGPVPGRLARARAFPRRPEPAADLVDAGPVPADPGEGLAHHPRLLQQDLVARLARAILLADVPVPERRAAEHAHRARLGPVALAPAAALEDLRALVLGDHPLHLQQEVVLRGLPERPVQEDHVHAGAPELIHQQHLIGVFAGQAVGRVDVEPVQPAGGGPVPQPLQRGPDQGGAAVALVEVLVLGQQQQAVRGGLGAHGDDLAGDGVRGDLLLGGDPRVQGGPWLAHACSFAAAARSPRAGRDAPSAGVPTVWVRGGTTWS